MLSANLGNSGKVMLYLFLTIGLVLGVTAFILVLTKKNVNNVKQKDSTF